MRVSRVWEEGIRRTSSEVCMDKGMCESQTAGSPRSPGSAKMEAKKNEWIRGGSRMLKGDIVCRPVGSNCVVVGALPKAMHRGV